MPHFPTLRAAAETHPMAERVLEAEPKPCFVSIPEQFLSPITCRDELLERCQTKGRSCKTLRS